VLEGKNKFRVKICGLTWAPDCYAALDVGADFLGVIYDIPSSPRSINFNSAEAVFEIFSDMTFLLTQDKPIDDDYKMVIEHFNPYALQLVGNESPEYVTTLLAIARRPIYKTIHLNPEGEAQPDIGQIVAAMNRYLDVGVSGFMLDTAVKDMKGGTGVKNNWSVAAKIVAAVDAQIFLAGGVNKDNIGEAMAIPGLYGVDMSSSVESAPGVKSKEKMFDLFGSMLRHGGS
jgi:phosphoribosylanthranilate isomerase